MEGKGGSAQKNDKDVMEQNVKIQRWQNHWKNNIHYHLKICLFFAFCWPKVFSFCNFVQRYVTTSHNWTISYKFNTL